jgi:hypothetical protein
MPNSATDQSSAEVLSPTAIAKRNCPNQEPRVDEKNCVDRELVPSLSGIGQEDGTHNVYVAHLTRDVLGKKKFSEANPERSSSGLCLYVGLTGLSPTERFKNHKSGYKASRWVREYGRGLLPRFYAGLNKMSYSRAEEVEVVLAEFLREKGHAVWQK